MKGFFGGSFDPVHSGHLHFARQLASLAALDEVLFVPAACSPFKEQSPPRATFSQRVAMLELALQDFPHCSIWTGEQERSPSYTIDSLRTLAQPLRLLLDEEAASHLLLWKEAEAIIQLAPPIVGVRALPSSPLPGVTYILLEPLSIRSTEVRALIAKGAPYAHLLPPSVAEYIEQHHLYR